MTVPTTISAPLDDAVNLATAVSATLSVDLCDPDLAATSARMARALTKATSPPIVTATDCEATSEPGSLVLVRGIRSTPVCEQRLSAPRCRPLNESAARADLPSPAVSA